MHAEDALKDEAQRVEGMMDSLEATLHFGCKTSEIRKATLPPAEPSQHALPWCVRKDTFPLTLGHPVSWAQ